MDWNVLMTSISTLGFPVAACVALALFYNKVNDSYRSDIKEMNASHRQEMDKITEAVNNNTMVIQKLLDKMEKDND